MADGRRANGGAARHLDEAVRAMTLNYGDASGCLAEAREADPGCAMADLLEAWLLALTKDGAQLARARDLLSRVAEAGLTEREGRHLAALRFAANGRWASAVAVLDRHLMNDPHDLAGHQCALRLDGYLGRFHREAARAARALPFWSKDEPGYGIMLSFYGFGLEELGDFARAEGVARTAAELEPYGYWPHHTVSHVLEMTGRPEEGIAWMDGRLPYWSDPKCNNRVHIWWHKALYHIELGRFEDALALYDDEILPAMRVAGTQLCNAASLLWRLETLGLRGGRTLEPAAPALAGAASRHDEPVQRGACRHDRTARRRQGRLRDGAGRHEADSRREQRARARLSGHLNPRRRGDGLLHRRRLCRHRRRPAHGRNPSLAHGRQRCAARPCGVDARRGRHPRQAGAMLRCRSPTNGWRSGPGAP